MTWCTIMIADTSYSFNCNVMMVRDSIRSDMNIKDSLANFNSKQSMYELSNKACCKE